MTAVLLSAGSVEDLVDFCPQTHLTFGKEFTEAVEMKQVAQQEAERARFIVEKVPHPPETPGNGSWYLLPAPACSKYPLAWPGGGAG